MTDKFCPNCMQQLVKSETEGYTYQCLNCDEDFYNFEVYSAEEIKVKH